MGTNHPSLLRTEVSQGVGISMLKLGKSWVNQDKLVSLQRRIFHFFLRVPTIDVYMCKHVDLVNWEEEQGK